MFNLMQIITVSSRDGVAEECTILVYVDLTMTESWNYSAYAVF